MYHFVPGYGMMGPAFFRKRSNIPPVAPVVLPAHPGPGGGAATAGAWAGGSAPNGFGGSAPAGAWYGAPSGRQVLAGPAAGSPLAVLAGTSLGPALADLIARAPQVAGALTGGEGGGAFPPDIPGMPKMPGPPAGMFTPGGGLGGPVAPVQVPDWYLAQQAGGPAPAGPPPAGPGAG